MKYDVSGTYVQNRTQTIEANTPQDAVMKFRDMNPNFMPQDVEQTDGTGRDWSLLHYCESCRKPILSDDQYSIDGEMECAFCDTCVTIVTQDRLAA